MLNRAVGILICCILAAAFPMTANADAAPKVTIAFDKDVVAVGETITATYEVSGTGKYDHVTYNWYIETGENEGQPQESEFSEGMSGEIQFTPKFGTGAYLVFSVEDENGRIYGLMDEKYRSERITITGDRSVPPVIEIDLNRDELAVGEEITADYRVYGDGNYKEVTYTWFLFSDENEIQPGKMDHTSQLQGSLSFVPQYGYGLFLSLTVEDENGRYYSYDSRTIPMTGDTTIAPQATVTFDKNTVALGEEITAAYQITGAGEYVEASYTWIYAVRRNGKDEWEPYSSNYGELDELSGTVSFVPRYGTKLCIGIDVRDGYGKYYDVGLFGDIAIKGVADDYERYTVIEGADMQWNTGKEALIFRADGSFDKFLGIQVDDEYVPDDVYKAWAGSTYVELSAEYLDNLGDGQHKLALIFSDGAAITRFFVDHQAEKIAQMPQTGDHSNMLMWGIALGTCALAAARLKGKRRQSQKGAE